MTEPARPRETVPDARQSFAALRHRGARYYLAGAALAMMADSIEHVISYWIIFEKFQSPMLGGFAIFSHWVPFLLFSIHAGALADRYDPRRVIQLGMVLFMLVSLGWGLLFLTDTLQMWHAAVLLVIHGFAGVLWSPAAQLLVHDIVGREQLQSAIRMMATSRTLGLLMGPAVGGGLMLAVGPTAGILINVLIYLPLTLWLWKAPYGPHFRKEKRPPSNVLGGFSDIVSTIRGVAGMPIIVFMTLLAGVTSLIVGNGYQAQMPEFAHDLGHADAGFYYTMLITANAAGALFAGVALESRGLLPARSKSAFVLAMLWCAAIGGFAVSASYLLALVLLFAAGFLNLAFSSMTRTLVQLHAPSAIRGRVIGLYNMSDLGLRSFSGITVGIGGGLVGIHWSLGLSAAALLVLTLALMSVAMRAEKAAVAAGG